MTRPLYSIAVILSAITAIVCILYFEGYLSYEQPASLRSPRININNVSSNSVSIDNKRCGLADHSHLTRPCLVNDTLCGHWTGRYFHPYGCEYQDINSQQARKCIGNRTLAFIGDSQIRDIGVAVAYLLMGIYEDMDDAPAEKFNHRRDIVLNSTQIIDFDIWKNNVPPHNYNGYFYPASSNDDKTKTSSPWQVQIWSLYNNKYLTNQVEYILNNSMSSLWSTLHPVDLAFWSHGLHDYGWFNTPPYGQKFYAQVANKWLVARKQEHVPSVWVSLNSECSAGSEMVSSNHRGEEELVVDEVNYFMNHKLLKYRLPYWDAAAVLRSRERCNVTSDGVHVKMYVDIMRAKMLLNHLCDSDMNWDGGPHKFI